MDRVNYNAKITITRTSSNSHHVKRSWLEYQWICQILDEFVTVIGQLFATFFDSLHRIISKMITLSICGQFNTNINIPLTERFIVYSHFSSRNHLSTKCWIV